MDEFTQNFLKENNLEDYIAAFKVHKVTRVTLPLLSNEMVSSLIIPFGDQVTFNEAKAKLVLSLRKKGTTNSKKDKEKKSNIVTKSVRFHETRADSAPISAILPENIFGDDFSSEESDLQQMKEEQREVEEDEDEGEGSRSESDTSQQRIKCLNEGATKKTEQKFNSRIKPMDRRRDSTESQTKVDDKENRNKVKKRKFEDTEDLDHEGRLQFKKLRSEKASSSGTRDEPFNEVILESIENVETVQDYQKYLQSIQDGRDIVNHYKKNRTLTKSYRELLVRLIISKLMAVQDGVLQNNDFESAAKVIVKLFESETVGTYYVAPVPRSKSPSAISTGKLPCRYRNVRKTPGKKLEKQETFDKEKEKSVLTEKFHLLPDKDFNEKKSFLDHHAEPWDEVCTLWKETSPNRLKQLLRQDDSNLETTMKIWPLFKHPSAPTLIIIDFAVLHKRKELEFLIHWPNSKAKIAEYMKENIVSQKALSLLEKAIANDYNDASILHLLPVLLNSAIIKKKGKKTWKPLILECQEAFIVCKPTKSEITETIEV